MWDVFLMLCLISYANSLLATPKWSDFKAIEFGESPTEEPKKMCNSTSDCEGKLKTNSDGSIIKAFEKPIDELGSEYFITNENISSFRRFGYEDSGGPDDFIDTEEGSGETDGPDGMTDEGSGVTDAPTTPEGAGAGAGDSDGDESNRTILIISIAAISVAVVAVIGVSAAVFFIRRNLRTMREEQREYLRYLDASSFESTLSIPRARSRM